MWWSVLALASAAAVACGSSDAPADDPGASNGASDGKPSTNGNGNTNGDGGGVLGSDAATGDVLVGLWDVQGSDARGEYDGQIEIRPDANANGSGYTFVRAVKYRNVSVEDGRELHWLFRGKLGRSGDKVSLDASLKRVDFIRARGATTRNPLEPPDALTGSFAIGGGKVTGSITGSNVSITDTWSAKKPLPATPLFEDKRQIVAAHDPPSAADKAAKFALYSGFHGLDIVKPYVNRPEFKAAIHGNIVDPTDLDFYRANPNALRVVDKPIDEISLGETRARADAYRYTLAKKAELYDQDAESRFIDPDVGMIPDGGLPGASFGSMNPSGDSSLWTGIYVASQVYRAQVTGSSQAVANVLRSLNAMLTLQEITGDWSKFARVLRKATGNPLPPWHAGTGSYANLEWMEGGNNDMIKGLFYSYVTSWELLCENGKTGYESYCTRIRTNAKHLADDVQLGGSNAPGSQYTNKLPAAWMVAVMSDDAGEALTYATKAEGYWAISKPVLKQNPESAFQGQVDGSGVHLGSVGDLVDIFLAKRKNLGGDAADVLRDEVDASYENIKRFRLPEWDVLAAAEGSSAGSNTKVAPIVANAVSRLVEMRYPKLSEEIDWRINPEFCMSPYPTAPWKGDWMQYPTRDRTTAINGAPLFATRNDVLMWKVNNDYRGGGNYETPAGDFLHLYWYARKRGLLSPTE